MMVRARLHPEFRYIHEPLPAGDPAIPVLGHEHLVTTLQERLLYSHGGAFLITGFRGVGKSTLVLRALAGTAVDRGRHDHLLLVHLNVARAMSADQLMFAIVRRIFEALDDSALLDRLPRDVLDSLLMAYARTSLSFKQTQTDSSERGGTAGIGPTRGMVGALAPALNLTGRRTRSQAMEAAFLAYSETDVEHDLIRIVRLLNGDEGRPHTHRGRRLRGRRREPRGRLRVHPVVVLDEVDKLTDNRPEAIAGFEELLGRLKNVLTTRGAHFLVVAGPDLHDRALQDGDRGNGVYESVFSWRAYVPCLWQAPERLVEGLVDPAPLGPSGEVDAEAEGPAGSDAGASAGPGAQAAPDAVTAPDAEEGPNPDPGPESGAGGEGDGGSAGSPGGTAPPPGPLAADDLVRYFRFKARGVPRRLLHEFNALVEWEDGEPFLAVGEADWARVRFYRDLQDVVAGIGDSAGARGIAELPIDEDRRQLGDYHVTDWALRSRGRPFTAADVLSTAGEQRLDPLLRVETVQVDQVLRHLARAGVLDRVSGGTQIAQYGRRYEGRGDSYRLSDAYRRILAGFARSNERERADQGGAWAGRVDRSETWVGDSRAAYPVPASFATATPLVGTLADGRYEIRELIGSGGMGSVYRGRDRVANRDVAIKMMHTSLAEDSDMRRRFEREVAVGQRLHHPHIVETLDAVFDDSGQPALVMEFVEGPALSDRIVNQGVMSPAMTVTVARHLGSALQAVETAELARIDVKPNNVILHPERGAVVIDLGLARALADADLSITRTGIVVGTLGFMAPEQVNGGPYSIRTDIYALGLVMIYCLTGRSGRRGDSSANFVAALHRLVTEDVPVDDLPGSAALRALIRRVTARDPDDRPAPAALLAALAALPEAAATRTGLQPDDDPPSE